jgi:hypothetical protein
MTSATTEMNLAIAELVKKAKPEEIVEILAGSEPSLMAPANNNNHNNNNHKQA